MKIVIKTLIIVAFISLNLNAYSQKRQCGSIRNLTTIQKYDPTLFEKIMEIELHAKQYVSIRKNLKSITKSTNTEPTIRIPVVVHVLWHTSAENISNAQIISQISILNEDYRRLNSDRTNTPTDFAAIAADMNIEFVLASKDPMGNPTNGITRTYTSNTDFTVVRTMTGIDDVATGIKFSSSNGVNGWPADSYLNIWVCNLNDAQGIMGYGLFPGAALNVDGVVVDHIYFGNTGTVVAPYDNGRTATHEVGHWLNLLHIWGDDDIPDGNCTSGECTGNDGVTDTPNQGERNYGCPAFPLTDCCTSTSPGVMFMNYMDYTDDACMNLFTEGQKGRSRALFAAGGARKNLCVTHSYRNSIFGDNQTINECNVEFINTTIQDNAIISVDVTNSLLIKGSFKAETGTTLDLR